MIALFRRNFINLSLLISSILIAILTISVIEKPISIITSILVFFFLLLLVHNYKLGLILLIFTSSILDKIIFLITGVEIPYSFYFPYFLIIFIILYENIIHRKKIIISLTFIDVILIILTLYILFSIFRISSNTNYGIDKFQFYLVSLVLFYLPVFLSKYLNGVFIFLKAVLIFGIIISLYSILRINGIDTVFVKDYDGRFNILDLNPIWIGRYLSYAFLVGFFIVNKLFIDWKKHIGKIFFFSVILIIFVYFILLTGSRGPLLALLITIIYYLLAKSNLSLYYSVLLLLLFVFIFLLLSSIIPTDLSERLTNTNYSGKSTVIIRYLATFEALENFKSNMLFGIGFGSFTLDNQFFSSLIYPHNVFLEMLSETGIIGFLFFTIIIFVPFFSFLKKRSKIEKESFILVVSFFIVSFINANLSGHIGANIYLWFSVGIMHYINLFVDNNTEFFKISL